MQWAFLEEMMVALSFPKKFVDRVVACVSTASFALNVNGNAGTLFQGKQGLRQGDPMPPLYFVICMEYISLAS